MVVRVKSESEIQGVIKRSANAHSAIKQWVFPLNVRLYRMTIGVESGHSWILERAGNLAGRARREILTKQITLDPRHFTLDTRHFTLDPRPSTKTYTQTGEVNQTGSV